MAATALSSDGLRQFAEDLSPLESPFSNRSVQCTDIVSAFEVSREAWSGGDVGEENRIRSRRDELRKTMIELEAQQLLVEKLFEFQAQGHVHEGALEVLQDGERAAVAKVAEAREKFTALQNKVQDASTNLTELIGTYEDRRHELVAKLKGLRQTLADEMPEGLNDLSAEACEELIEKEVAEMQSLNERRKTLQDTSASAEARVADLQTETEKLTEQAQAVEAALQAAEEQSPDDQMSQVQEKLAWVNEVRSMLDSITGVTVSDFQETSFVVQASGENLRVQLFFDPETSLLTDAKVSSLSGNDADDPKALYARRRDLHARVLEEAVRRNDIRFLVRELRESVRCGRALDKELTVLRQTCPVSVADTEVIVTLPEGIVATFEVGLSYPRLYAAARLTSMEAFNGWKKSLMTETVEFVQKEQCKRRHDLYTLSALTQLIRDRIEAIQAEQTKDAAK